MKTIKRISAIFLAIVMVFSLVPVLWKSYNNASAISLIPTESQVTITYSAGSGTGTSFSETYEIKESGSTTISLLSASSLGFKAPTGYEFDGWKIGSSTYWSSYTFRKSDASKNSSDQYSISAVAQWSKTGSSSSTTSGKIVGTFKPGDGEGSSFNKSYSTEVDGYDGYYVVTFPSCPFKKEGYVFDGWSLSGEIFDEGDQVGVNSDFTATATWKKATINIGGGSSSSSSSSASSSTSSSSSSSASSSTSSSSSNSASSSKSSSSSSVSSSSSSSEESSSSSSTSSVSEEQEPNVFTPISLSYSITGDVPVSGIKFLLNEDLGGNAQLWISALDSASAVDNVTADFISSGNALAAFDLSLLLDGSTYHGYFSGTVTFDLNGTQANAVSNFDEYVTALVHVIDAEKYTGSSYYMTDGKKAYLYSTSTGIKSEVGNITFDEKDGVYRPVISDIDNLSEFAYLAKDGTIVEVVLIPDANVSSVSMNVSSFSPMMLVHLEIGEASSGTLIPVWAWIVIGVLVLLIVVFVALFLYNRSNQKKNSSESRSTSSRSSSGKASSGITGLDDDF